KIVLHLKNNCRKFSSEDRVKEVVTKYSNFVTVSSLQALWMMEHKDISEWKNEEFYRYDKPRYTLHYRADAPTIGCHVITFAGVVDHEDIPLNLSRELLQESALIRKLRDVLEQRVTGFLLDQSKKDPEKYARFFDDYGLFLREGIVTTAEQSVKEDSAKLLCFESSALPAGQQASLMEYTSRVKAGTRSIYYLCALNHHLAEHSPYFDSMKQKDMEICQNDNCLINDYMYLNYTHPAMIPVLEMGIKNLIETTQLRKPLWKFLINCLKIAIHALISTRLDYCNVLYKGISQSSISHLQKVQNS
uniref:Uncharacterized protein n=1 Tax=Cyprinus carpio carpio TaxID=630221 RepID=A0A8C1FI80_CYPCA